MCACAVVRAVVCAVRAQGGYLDLGGVGVGGGGELVARGTLDGVHGRGHVGADGHMQTVLDRRVIPVPKEILLK